MKITNSEMKVVRFASDDVIAKSLYIVSKTDWDGTESDAFLLVRGTMGGYDEDEKAWGVGGFNGGYSVVQEGSMEELLNTPYGKDIYYAYKAENDGIYTKGATYWEIENQ